MCNEQKDLEHIFDSCAVVVGTGTAEYETPIGDYVRRTSSTFRRAC